MEPVFASESTLSTNRVRMVGTFTLGFTLILFGILFALQTFMNILGYTFILKLWPIILILLGLEVLVSYLYNKTGTFRYDKGAIFLIFVLSGFAMCMAIADFLVTYSYDYVQRITF